MNGPVGEYESFAIAYDHFNACLFGGRLPLCMITLVNRRKGSYGYFVGGQFQQRTEPNLVDVLAKDGPEHVDEIALMPDTFKRRTDRDILSTLVHEMVHCWQHHFGKRPRKAYHDRQWAKTMKEIGLHPSSTAAPGGKEVGAKMSHYIIEGGGFDVAYQELADNGFKLEWNAFEFLKLEKEKKKSKVKYACPECGANAWAKPKTKLVCGECMSAMQSEDDDDDETAD